MGCSNSNVSEINYRPKVVTDVEYNNAKDNFIDKKEKLNLVMVNENLLNDLTLVKSNADYYIFYNKHDAIINKVGFDKESFKEAFWNSRAEKDLEKLVIYKDNWNVNSVISNVFLELTNGSEDDKKNICTFFIKNIRKIPENLNGILWISSIYSSFEKPYLLNNLKYNPYYKCDVINISLNGEDLNSYKRMMDFAKIIQVRKPSTVSISLMPIGNNYTSELEYKFDCNNISYVLDALIENSNLNNLLIGTTQRLNMDLDSNTIYKLKELVKNKFLFTLSLIRLNISFEDQKLVFENIIHNNKIIFLVFENCLDSSKVLPEFADLLRMSKGIQYACLFNCNSNEDLKKKYLENAKQNKNIKVFLLEESVINKT